MPTDSEILRLLLDKAMDQSEQLGDIRQSLEDVRLSNERLRQNMNDLTIWRQDIGVRLAMNEKQTEYHKELHVMIDDKIRILMERPSFTKEEHEELEELAYRSTKQKGMKDKRAEWIGERIVYLIFIPLGAILAVLTVPAIHDVGKFFGH